MTFTFIIPFLKGIHLTLDSWRIKRGTDGWKMSDKEWEEWLSNKAEDIIIYKDSGNGVESEVIHHESSDSTLPPLQVAPIPRLFDDIVALHRIFEQEQPPEVIVRVSTVMMVVFALGDTSGLGFGSSFSCPLLLGY